MKTSIRVAVVGVGNCAKSLIEGVALYKREHQRTAGLAFRNIGGYDAGDMEFVLAYDVDTRKVGRPLEEAIYAQPNCAVDLFSRDHEYDRDHLRRVAGTCTLVKKGALYDGVAPHMLEAPEHRSFRVTKDPEPTKDDVVKDLRENNVDVLINYLPVGSETATRFYVECCLEAGVAFVNCIPVFIVSDPYWDKKLREAGIPAIGDDMRSQLGASVVSQALQELFLNRGMVVHHHKQVNDGGNTDFLNMMDASRLESKKTSKENVIRAQNEIRSIPIEEDGVYAGPSSYIPYQGDNKQAYFTIVASGFGGAPVRLEAKLSVEDSPNSAGVVIDAIRYLQVAKEMGLVGSLRGPSAATQKTPPEQLELNAAFSECSALAEREVTPMMRLYNIV